MSLRLRAGRLTRKLSHGPRLRLNQRCQLLPGSFLIGIVSSPELGLTANYNLFGQGAQIPNAIGSGLVAQRPGTQFGIDFEGAGRLAGSPQRARQEIDDLLLTIGQMLHEACQIRLI